MERPKWYRTAFVMFCVAGSFAGAASIGLSAAPSRSGRLAVKPQVVARAKQVVIGLRDFRGLPGGRGLWFNDPLSQPGLINQRRPRIACNRHVADLSRVVLNGGWNSRFAYATASRQWLVISTVAFLETADQAEIVHNAEVQWNLHYCEQQAPRGADYKYVSIRQVPVLALADDTVDLRTLGVRTTGPHRGEKVGDDRIFVLSGRMDGVLQLSWSTKPEPPAIRDALLKKFAARAHL